MGGVREKILSRLIENLGKTKNEQKTDERERVGGEGERTGKGSVRREKFRCFSLKNRPTRVTKEKAEKRRT